MASPYPPEGFPEYANADVEVVLSPIRVLRLHSDVLSGMSAVFKNLLTDENAALLSSKKKASGYKIRYRIELVSIKPPGDVGHLRAINLDVNGCPLDDGGPRANMDFDGNGRDPSCHLLDDWYNVMAAFYGITPQIGTTEDVLFNLLQRAVNIGSICDYLKLTKSNSIYAPIETALLDTNQELWRSVKSSPDVWIDLAKRLKSFPIFREAIVHLIGLWYRLSEAKKDDLDDDVYELCDRKAEKFKQYMKDLEDQIIAYRPAPLLYDKDKDGPKGKREHEPEVFRWIAYSGFQVWLIKAFRDGKGVDGPDDGFDLFARFFAGHEAYYDREAQTDYVGVTHVGRAVISQHIDGLKNDLKRLVASVMTSSLRLDTSRGGIDYFTCFGVDLWHCPWAEDMKPTSKYPDEIGVEHTTEDGMSSGEETANAEGAEAEETIEYEEVEAAGIEEESIEDEDMGDFVDLVDEDQSDDTDEVLTVEDDPNSLFV